MSRRFRGAEKHGAGVNCSVNGCEHGTHMAGIAPGAEAALGFDGVARGAAFIAIQVFSRFQDSRGLTPCATSGLRSPCVQAYTSDLMSELRTCMMRYAVRSISPRST
jgi:hypothetical protein